MEFEWFIPKTHIIIYYFVPNGRFFRNSSLFSFGRGSFLVLPVAAPAGGRRGQYGASVGPGRAP